MPLRKSGIIWCANWKSVAPKRTSRSLLRSWALSAHRPLRVNRLISERKLRANAENAKKSTGPRSPGGKAQSSRNASSHGLSIPIHPGTPEGDAVDELTELLAEGSDDPEILMQAATIAECTVTLDRIARLRS